MSEHDDWAEINRLEAENARLRAERDTLRAQAERYAHERAHYRAEWSKVLSERDAAVARAERAKGLLLDAYNTWGEWPQETLSRIADFLNKGGGDET